MQTRLMVCAHMKDAGHRGVVATLQRLQGYCSWFRMEVHVTPFVKQCLHCMDSKAGEKIRRPLGETMHGRRSVGFCMYVGDSGPLGTDRLDGEFEMAGIVDISEAGEGQVFDVKGLGWIRRGREFVGAACGYMGRRPAVCQVGAAEIENL